jgi:hypothetical protein
LRQVATSLTISSNPNAVTSPATESERFERALLLLSLVGPLLAHHALAKLGRWGVLLVEGVCLLLMGRVIQLIAHGAPGRLRKLPRTLIYAELAADSLAVSASFLGWVQPEFGAPEQGLSPRRALMRRLSTPLLALMFLVHSVRFAIYLSPDSGRRDGGEPPAA